MSPFPAENPGRNNPAVRLRTKAEAEARLRLGTVVELSGQSRPRCTAPFENETWIASAMIIASSADRAMTVREWDPALQRSAWGYGPCWAPLPDSHGSVNWRRLFRFLVG